MRSFLIWNEMKNYKSYLNVEYYFKLPLVIVFATLLSLP